VPRKDTRTTDRARAAKTPDAGWRQSTASRTPRNSACRSSSRPRQHASREVAILKTTRVAVEMKVFIEASAKLKKEEERTVAGTNSEEHE